MLRVMIASPSDVPEARDAVEKAIHSWNDANSKSKGIVLQPWRWETSAVPLLGSHPQALINAQGVDDSDIVFALFGGRLGSPTPEAASGTAEEVDRALGLGKPVHLYFSTAPLPNDIDTSQLEALRRFKESMQERGLLGEFSNPEQLGYEVWRAIEHDISRFAVDENDDRRHAHGVDFLVQPHQEREVSGLDSRGAPRYRTNHWLEITNRGGKDAEEVRFESLDTDGGMHIHGPESPTIVHRGQTRRLGVSYTFGASSDPILRIRWVEDDEDRQQDFHVG